VAAPLRLRYWSMPVMARTLTIAAVLKAPFGLASEASRFAWESLATTAAVGVLGSGIAFVLSAGRSLAVSVDAQR
jgi:threonine/homoserine efflux transporter RhtA